MTETPALLPPMFTIIVAHYQGSIPHEIFCRGIASIEAQTFKDYELLVFHDGPFLDPDPEPGGWPFDVMATEQRYDDWGHTLRHTGIAMARGCYIVHFNADNVLYPNALERIAREIMRPPVKPEPGPGHEHVTADYDRNEIIIFPIKAFGLRRVFGWFVEQRPRGDTQFCEILTGNPPMFHNIDAMQLVMRRDLWLAEGGWYDKSRCSDGIMYPKFCEKYGYRTVDEILGEHH
jgi:hypothetical protein